MRDVVGDNLPITPVVDDYKKAYEGACVTIARLHAAIMGEVTGPNRGVVEDAADVRQELSSAKHELSKATYKLANIAQLLIGPT